MKIILVYASSARSPYRCCSDSGNTLHTCLQAVHALSPGSSSSALVLPAAHSTGHHTAVYSTALPQLHSYSDSLHSGTGAGAGSAAAVAPLAAIPAVAGQLLSAFAVHGQQPQPQGVKAPAANDDDDAVAAPLQQQQQPAEEPALGADASKEAAYEALWQWVSDVGGAVSYLAVIYACRRHARRGILS
jgi:hypothetical protein